MDGGIKSRIAENRDRKVGHVRAEIVIPVEKEEWERPTWMAEGRHLLNLPSNQDRSPISKSSPSQ